MPLIIHHRRQPIIGGPLGGAHEYTLRSGTHAHRLPLYAAYVVQVLTRCRDLFGPQIDSYFKAPVFLKFDQDSNGCISANQFLNYLNLRNTTQQNVGRRGVRA
jgi:hypothetical protein